jgi:DNA-directed RNA polymerase subunit N (RpoN/RPB10)
MYSYITCRCGRPIGDIDDLFIELKRLAYIRYLAEHNIDTDPSMLAIDEDLQVDLSEVFKMLNIHTECCRSVLMSQVKFNDLY